MIAYQYFFGEHNFMEKPATDSQHNIKSSMYNTIKCIDTLFDNMINILMYNYNVYIYTTI